MTGVATALESFMTLLVSGIKTLAAGIAEGVADMATALFLTTSSDGAVTGLSVFGGIIGIFAGIALAISITSKVYMWVVSLGAR